MRGDRSWSSRAGLLPFGFAIKLVIALVIQVNPVEAQTELQGSVRSALDVEPPLWVGQGVRLTIDMLSTGFIFSNQDYDVPDVPGALVLQTNRSAVNLTEREDGETWQVLRYEMRVYPQRAGEVAIPPIDVSFSVSAGFGQEESTFRFQTEELRLVAMLPPGVGPGMPLVTADSLEVSQVWEPERTDVMVGDALRRSVTLHADGIPGMVLPPLSVPDIDGMGVYPADPGVTTTSNRGRLRGERTDVQDLVFEQPGEYEIPGYEIQWWQPTREELTVVEIDSLGLAVAPNPALEAAVKGQRDSAVDPGKYGLWLLLVLILAVVIFRTWPTISSWLVQWCRRRSESEPAHFRRLAKACRGRDPATAYMMLSRWLARWFGPGTPATLAWFAGKMGDPILAAELERLQTAVTERDRNWNGRRLYRSLSKARRILSAGERSAPMTLPPLNRVK